MERISLREAIGKWARPGMHLHFASTPSRSNAAILGLAQAFAGEDPRFVLSTTGFHSTAHLLAVLRLGRRYLASFFGDNYPSPRPNPLYQELQAAGQLEHWSLLTYVQSFRAASLGQNWTTTASLSGSTLALELEDAKRYRELDWGEGGGHRLAAITAMRPDIAFLHAPATDTRGRALFSPPYSEGFFAALAARVGVIITTDRIVEPAVVDRYPGWVPIPPHRVLASVESPFGAHPQPVYLSAAELGDWGYVDDFDHYIWWRKLTQEPALFEEFREQVLARDEVWPAYLEFVGTVRLEGLKRGALPARTAVSKVAALSSPPAKPPTGGRRQTRETPRGLRPIDAREQRQRMLAAVELCARVKDGGFAAVLAGIGLAFGAARLGLQMLTDNGQAARFELLVETGLCGLREDADHPLDDFLLSSRNYAAASRLGSVESVLGVQVSGQATRCLAIVGAGQVAPCGSWNSTRVGGQLLVGSGGAADIAIGADEVLLVTRWARLVPNVEYVTGVGRRVSRIITEVGVLRRDLPPLDRSPEQHSELAPSPWRLCATGLSGLEVEQLLRACPWPSVTVAPDDEQILPSGC